MNVFLWFFFPFILFFSVITFFLPPWFLEFFVLIVVGEDCRQISSSHSDCGENASCYHNLEENPPGGTRCLRGVSSFFSLPPSRYPSPVTGLPAAATDRGVLGSELLGDPFEMELWDGVEAPSFRSIGLRSSSTSSPMANWDGAYFLLLAANLSSDADDENPKISEEPPPGGFSTFRLPHPTRSSSTWRYV